MPQRLRNVRFQAGQAPLEEATGCKKRLPRLRRCWTARGGCLIRKSGTEPLVRVMAESEDAGLMTLAVDSVVAAVEAAVAE